MALSDDTTKRIRQQRSEIESLTERLRMCVNQLEKYRGHHRTPMSPCTNPFKKSVHGKQAKEEAGK